MRKFVFAAAAVGLAVSAMPAAAVDARQRVEDQGVTVDAAWKVIGDFCGIGTWHPAVATCVLSKDGDASIRTLTLKDGAVLVEKLVEWNEAEHQYTYTILESPLPVANYTSTLSVKEDDEGGAGIRWVGTFDAKGASDDEAKKIIEGIYEAGLDAILAKAIASN